MSEIILTIEGVDTLTLYGLNDININLLRKAYSEAVITSRGNQIKISGDKKQAQEAKNKIETMVRVLRQYQELTEHQVRDILNSDNPFENRLSSDNPTNVIVYGVDGTPIKARTRNQKKLVDASEDNDIVFAVGPAGTGKTYTAVALAVRALKARRVKRIILTRPAVEAGENLGFLPGDLKEKIDPYLRPLYDALDDMIPAEKLQNFMASRIIEVAPLAFMRGRTLDNAFIILDEAQNCTSLQIKMFLTRLGPSAKCIVTGDLTQIDLPRNQKSGLYDAFHLLRNIDGISVIHLENEDVVRHRLVREIVKAYEKADDERKQKAEDERKQREEEANNKA